MSDESAELRRKADLLDEIQGAKEALMNARMTLEEIDIPFGSITQTISCAVMEIESAEQELEQEEGWLLE